MEVRKLGISLLSFELNELDFSRIQRLFPVTETMYESENGKTQYEIICSIVLKYSQSTMY